MLVTDVRSGVAKSEAHPLKALFPIEVRLNVGNEPRDAHPLNAFASTTSTVVELVAV